MPNSLPGTAELETLLRDARRQFRAANANRKAVVKLARSHGMTFRAIGAALGYSESRIRDIAKEP